MITGRLTRKRIPRTNDYTQAGERYLLSEQWEKDDLVANLDRRPVAVRPRRSRSGWSGTCSWPRTSSASGSARASASRADDVRGLAPLQTQTLTEEELQRAANLGKNGPRDVTGLTMTHCVPNERVALAEDEQVVGA